jgi:subtilisin-like proprotein convertase family protein
MSISAVPVTKGVPSGTGAAGLPTQPEPSWFTDDWDRWTLVIVDNNGNPSDLVDYQLRIEVPFLAGMQADYDDVRFTENGGAAFLPYWVERSDAASAVFWVKVPSILANSFVWLLMYYDNPAATSDADGNDVFMFFDDFEGASLDTTKWIGDTSQFTVAGGDLHGGNTNYLIQTSAVFSNPIVIETRTKANTLAFNGQSTLGFYSSAWNSIGLLEHYDPNPPFTRYWYRNDGNWNGPWTYDFYQWHNARISINGVGDGNLYVINDLGATATNNFWNIVSDERISLGLRYDAWYSNQAYDQQWQWILARQFTAEPPSAYIQDSGSWLTFVPVLPMGGMVYKAEVANSVPYVNAVDRYTASLDGDQTVTFTMDAAPGLQPWYRIVADGDIMVSYIGAAGECCRWSGSNDVSSDWTFLCGSASGSTGAYTVQVVLNAEVEDEGTVNGAETNNAFASAEDIGDSFISAASGSERGAVLGDLSGSLTGGRYDVAGLPVAVPPSGTFGMTQVSLNVMDSFTINDVNVFIRMTHTWDSDLEIRLIGPGGAPTVILADNVGGSGDNFWDTMFDDEAATTIGAGAPPYTGSYRPSQPLTAFDGMDSAGTWTLQADDQAGLDAGALYIAYIVFNNVNSYPARDFYTFWVEDGEIVDVSAKALTGTFIDVTLYSPSQTLLATGNTNGTTNVDCSIRAYEAESTGSYYLRVRADGLYSIIITKDCHFNLEPNDPVGSAWWLSPTYRMALGHVTVADSDVYRYDLVEGETINAWVFAPGFEPGWFVNTLVPTVMIYGPAQVALDFETAEPGEDNVLLTHTAAETGTYYIFVGTSSGGGEYTLFMNSNPIAVDDNVAVNEDSVDNAIYPLGNDIDPEGDPIYIDGFSSASHGYAEWVNLTCLFYTPDADYYGSDVIQYWIADIYGGWDTAYIFIDVTNVQDAPIAEDDAYTVWRDSSDNEFDVLENDFDADGDVLIIQSVSMPGHGTVLITDSGTRVSYTPAMGYSGADTFTYTLSDGNGNTETATVNIDVLTPPAEPVEPVNVEQPPIKETVSGSSATVNLIAANGIMLVVLITMLVALFRRREDED